MSEVTLQRWYARQSDIGVPYLIARFVENHPINGTSPFLHSTPIIWLDPDRGLAQTINTLYHLGYPSPLVSSPEHRELVAKLHPKFVPDEIRRAHARRRPWPDSPEVADDVVYQWVFEHWAGLKYGKDY